MTLYSRAGVSREAADAAVAKLEIHELPSARNCTYVLPAEDFALGLMVGQRLSGGDLKTGYRLGVTEKEIDTLCAAILKTLRNGSRVAAAAEGEGEVRLRNHVGAAAGCGEFVDFGLGDGAVSLFAAGPGAGEQRQIWIDAGDGARPSGSFQDR